MRGNRFLALVVFVLLGTMLVASIDWLPEGPGRQVHANGLVPRAYLPLIMLPPIKADFTAAPTSGIAPLTVNFANTSTGHYTASLWGFGDTVTSTLTSPSHIYTVAGIYTVTLTVSRSSVSDTLTHTNYITVYAPVNAGFGGSPISGTAPLTVDFINLSTGDYDTCAWAFGDDGSSDDCNDPSHDYLSAGVYTVSLTVSGPGGVDTLTRTNYIAVASILENGSFEDGWTDMPPAPGNLINQQPNGWTLSWIEPGQPLYDDPGSNAGGVPECVHKHNDTLPPDEQLGGPEALILDGVYTYKMFHFGAPFGSQLTQTVTGLVPGSSWRLTVPILVDLHGDPNEWTAESGVWVNGTGGWANAWAMGDRNWYSHTVDFVAPGSGEITILIRVKSKWASPKDFFIDRIQLEMVTTGSHAEDY